MSGSGKAAGRAATPAKEMTTPHASPAVSLREYVEAEIRAVRAEMQAKLDAAERLNVERYGRLCDGQRAAERANEIALQAADKANTKSEENQRHINLTQNEFRGTLSDQAAQLMPRKEAEQGDQQNAEKIAALTDRMNRGEGRSSGYAGLWALIVGGIGVAAVIFGVVWAVAHGGGK